jgi:hypothetical protein
MGREAGGGAARVTLAAREGIAAPGTEVTSGAHRRRGLAGARDEAS